MIGNTLSPALRLCSSGSPSGVGVYVRGDWRKKRLLDEEEVLTGKVSEEILVAKACDKDACSPPPDGP